MKFMNIMVPFDKSLHAQRALRIAAGMAEEDPAIALHVVGVVSVSDIPPAMGMDMNPIDEMPATMLDPAVYTELVDEAVSREVADMHKAIGQALDNLPNAVNITAVNSPSIVEGIVDFADDHNCDLIVMGSRGLGILRGMLGSVSRGVMRETDLPVLVAKDPTDK